MLFNIVIDHLLRSLPKVYGLRFGGGTTRARFVANDMNLIAETPLGLQDLIDHSMAYLLPGGIKINQAKSHTVSIAGLGKGKKTVVDVRQTFTINGLPTRALSRADGWTYLGISFTPGQHRI